MAAPGVALQPAPAPEAPQAAPAVPHALVEAFARAVAAPRRGALVYLGGGVNDAEEHLSPLARALHLAATEARPFAVYTRADILAGDWDKPEQAGAALDLAGELRALGLDPVLVASGQPKHRHLFVRVPDPELRDQLAARFKAAGADVRRKAPIRPPLSPHRLGFPVKLLAPTSPAAALAALAAPAAAPSASPAPSRPTPAPKPVVPVADERPRRELTDNARRLLAANPPGPTATAKGQRSEAIRSALVAIANTGATEGEAWATITANPIGRRYTTGDRSRAHFAKEWADAVRFVNANPAFLAGADVRERVAAMLAEQEAKPWPGKAGASAFAILRAHAAIACRRGALPYTAAVRELAERTGLSLPTVQAANARLQQMGLLAKARTGRLDQQAGRQATAWRLLLPARTPANVADLAHTNRTLSPSPRPGLNVQVALRSEGLLRHDATRWGRGLGKAAAGLLLALEAGPASVCQLAARFCRHRVSVSRQLGRLVAVGLVARGEGKRALYRLAVEPDELLAKLDRVAVRLGTAGRGERVRRIFAQQRLALDAGRSSGPVSAPKPKPTGSTFTLKPGRKFAGRQPQEDFHGEKEPQRRVAARVRRKHGSRDRPGGAAASR